MDPELPERKSVRLPEWDYAGSAAYHVVLVTAQRLCIFGRVVDGQMILSPCGEIADEEWLATAARRQEVELDVYQVMPNHLHAIVWLRGPDAGRRRGRRPARGPAPRSLGSLVSGYKAAVTRRIRAHWQAPEAVVWQRNYYEHIIRNERDLIATRQYILDNPANWAKDEERPPPEG